MTFIEQTGYYGLHTLATPLLWWTLTIAAVLLYFYLFPVKRPRIRYYTSIAVLLSLPVGVIVSFMPSSIYTTVTAPENMTWIAAPEITITEGTAGTSGIRSYEALWSGVILFTALGLFLIFFCRFIFNLCNLSILKSTSTPVYYHNYNRLLFKLQTELSITRPVQLLHSTRVSSPVSFGWKNPVIILPAGAVQHPESNLKPVLVHELQHIKHCDYLISLLTECVTMFLAFHPGTWLLRRHLYRYQEMHCDAMVLGHRPCNPADYARTLLDYCTASTVAKNHPACTISRSGSQIRERILMMNRYPREEQTYNSSYSFWVPFLGVGFFLTATTITSCDLTTGQGENNNPAFANESFDSEPALKEGVNSILADLQVAEDEIDNDQIKVDVAVGADGSVEDIRVEKSMGETFDRAFTDAIEQADWMPAENSGEPVAGHTTIGFNFSREEQHQEPEPEGGIEAIYQNLEYPESARRTGIEGVAIVGFTVDEQGELDDFQILRDIGGETGEAVIEAIQSVNWNPGYKDGQPSEFSFQVPIRFQLNE